jgi:hypothetical protein
MVQGPFEEGMSKIQGSLEEDIDEAGNRKQAESTSDIIFQPWTRISLIPSTMKRKKGTVLYLPDSTFYMLIHCRAK